MKHEFLAIVILTGCATSNAADPPPAAIPESNRAAPTRLVEAEPEDDESRVQGEEIDLGFGGSYGNVEVERSAAETSAQSPPSVDRKRRERARLGEPCGGVGYVRCDVDLFCANRPLQPWEEGVMDVMGVCHSCDNLEGKHQAYCRRSSRSKDIEYKF